MPDNLGVILNKRVIAYKRYDGGKGLTLQFEDHTILDVKIESDQHGEDWWLTATVTAPDDDQWIRVVGA
jgi:hypothetical protein